MGTVEHSIHITLYHYGNDAACGKLREPANMIRRAWHSCVTTNIPLHKSVSSEKATPDIRKFGSSAGFREFKAWFGIKNTMFCFVFAFTSSVLLFSSNLDTTPVSDFFQSIRPCLSRSSLEISYNYTQIISLLHTAFCNDALKCLIFFRYNIMLINTEQVSRNHIRIAILNQNKCNV
jgi:hypothetical protein